MRETVLRRRIRIALLVVIAGLVVAGATAIPIVWELDLLGPLDESSWVGRVREALRETYAKYPFMAYGTDWLAFAHFVIAIAFLGPLRDPVRNAWVVDFGILACLLVIPAALIFGELRGIPFGWRLIDCSFGAGGLVLLLLARRWIRELARITPPSTPP
ncbi:MAG: hypothetical protein ACYTAF_09605 [Planctomycetota bacterium]|jgi:hypothetical protein